MLPTKISRKLHVVSVILSKLKEVMNKYANLSIHERIHLIISIFEHKMNLNSKLIWSLIIDRTINKPMVECKNMTIQTVW